MKPTIKDVAKKAGVSLATVSRVLNDSGYYEEETARKVREAVDQLGYRPNVHWTRLKRNTSETICFLLGNRHSMNSMQMRVLVACETALHERGYDLVFTRHCYDSKDRGEKLKLPRMLMQEGIVDGVVLAGIHHPNLLERLSAQGLPHVLLGNNFTGRRDLVQHDTVFYDDESVVAEATEYLLRMGHRRIAFVGNTNYLWFRRRQQGYRRAVREARVQEMCLTHDWQVSGVEYGQLAVAELLRGATQPTAILAANDEIAAGVWKELVRRGVSIPRQMSLIGFGDREEFSILEPALSSVSVFPEQLGTALAKMLLEKLANPQLKLDSLVLPCKIVERSSCAPPASRSGVGRLSFFCD